jgi:hypothetical protein
LIVVLSWTHNAVAVARRLTGNEYAGGGATSVEGLMTLAGGDFEAFAGAKDVSLMLDFEGKFSFQHVEELVGVIVEVTPLGGAWGHEFFDNAEGWSFDEVPTVAVGALRASPLIVVGGFGADGRGHALYPWFE